MSWPEFVGLVRRAGRYSAREMLQNMDAVSTAIGRALGGDSTEIKSLRKDLHRMAYPEDEQAIQGRIQLLKDLEASHGA